MSDLASLRPSLQRALAVPGSFETLFPDTLDADLTGLLMDAFAEAQLDGWLTAHTLDDLGIVTPDLTTGESALVVLYAAARTLVVEIRNRKTHVRYESGTAVFEQDQSATLLVELLREMNLRKRALAVAAARGDLAGAFYMDDAYLARLAE